MAGTNNNPLGIFPEGTATNGVNLLPFKKGAFISLTPIKPVIIKFTGPYFSPNYDSVDFLPNIILCFCQW